MTYENIVPARFLDRPNRFIAHARLESGEAVTVHVKNTGRCRELLTPEARILLQKCDDPSRKTGWDLISVYKGETLINMDSTAPNRVIGEWLRSGGIPGAGEIRPEVTRGDSRFDFGFSLEGRPAFAEVKGVTLEEEGVARFPDAPSERAVKHLKGLKQAAEEGYPAYVIFLIQMKGVYLLQPNWRTHEAFGLALKEAAEAGVRLLALDAVVTETSLTEGDPVPISLERG